MRYAFRCTGRYDRQKESPSRRRAFLVLREIYARLYRTTPGAGERRGGIGQSAVEHRAGPRLREIKNGVALTTQIRRAYIPWV
jgi:hypothetical protein